MPSTVARSPISADIVADVIVSDYPKRLWLKGPSPFVPQEQIRIAGSRTALRFENGVIEVRDTEQEAVVRRAMGAKLYDEDLPDHMAPRICKTCGWITRSLSAYADHLDVHPPGQTG